MDRDKKIVYRGVLTSCDDSTDVTIVDGNSLKEIIEKSNELAGDHLWDYEDEYTIKLVDPGFEDTVLTVIGMQDNKFITVSME